MRARDAPHRQASRPANPMRPGAPRHAVALAPSRVHGEVRTRCVRRASSASDGMPRANAGLTSAARRCPSCHDGRGTRSQYQWNPILTTRIMRCVSFVHSSATKTQAVHLPKETNGTSGRSREITFYGTVPGTTAIRRDLDMAATPILSCGQHRYLASAASTASTASTG